MQYYGICSKRQQGKSHDFLFILRNTIYSRVAPNIETAQFPTMRVEAKPSICIEGHSRKRTRQVNKTRRKRNDCNFSIVYVFQR